MMQFFFLLAPVIFLSACNTQSKPSAPVTVYNQDALAALQQSTTTYTKDRTAIEFESGEKVSNCNNYIALSKKSTLKEDVNVQAIKNEYLICDVLALLSGLQPVAGSATTNSGKILAEQLDLRSFPSSLFQMLDDAKYTLMQLDANSVKTTATTATSENNEWHYRLELIAVGDLNKNGATDWVLWLSDESKSGNYRNYQTLVAYDVTHATVIMAAPIPDSRQP